MTQNCNYQELEQVVKVELVKDAACDIDEPYFIAGLTETPGTKTVGGETIDRIGEPDIVVAMDVADGTTAEMEACVARTSTWCLPPTTARAICAMLPLAAASYRCRVSRARASSRRSPSRCRA